MIGDAKKVPEEQASAAHCRREEISCKTSMAPRATTNITLSCAPIPTTRTTGIEVIYIRVLSHGTDILAFKWNASRRVRQNGTLRVADTQLTEDRMLEGVPDQRPDMFGMTTRDAKRLGGLRR